MISKIRKYQDSWLTKLILGLTALSFMSLFGVSGYVNSAGKNRAVLKVDNMEILQDEMNAKLQDSIRKSQKVLGYDLELNDDTRKDILSSLVKQNITDMIIMREAQKEDASISDELIQQIIASQPEFMDASGRFSPELLRRQLSYFDMSEKEYINNLKQNILSRHLVYSPVENIAFPQFMNNYYSQIANQQKVFAYITVDPSTMKIDRDITEEEIEQYYEDFAPQFEESESRDVSFINLKIADLAEKMQISDEDISSYYQDNLADYVVPETRQALQMVFDSEESATEAVNLLNGGKDFYDVALQKANQDKQTTELGDVTADSLLPELSQDVFDAKINDIVGPIKSDFGWHIIKVTKITPKQETPLSEVKGRIKNILQQEYAYEKALEVMQEIDDMIGNGATLNEIADKYDAKIVTVNGLKEDGSYKSIGNKKYADIVSSSDFIDTAFSYNENEITQTIETEDSFVLASVNKIDEAKIKELEQVRHEIVKIWAENEKSAIAQEVVNDIVANLDEGNSLSDIASRFNLKLNQTQPLKKGEAFAKLNSLQLNEVFQTPLNEYRLISGSGVTNIISPVKVIKAKASTDQQLETINTAMQKDLEDNLASELIDDYAQDMDVRIKYKLLGLEN